MFFNQDIKDLNSYYVYKIFVLCALMISKKINHYLWLRMNIIIKTY